MTSEEILRQTGSKIRALRVDRGILQQDLAAACHFEASALSRIEAGRINVTIGTLNKIATALDVPLKELVPPVAR